MSHGDIRDESRRDARQVLGGDTRSMSHRDIGDESSRDARGVSETDLCEDLKAAGEVFKKLIEIPRFREESCPMDFVDRIARKLKQKRNSISDRRQWFCG